MRRLALVLALALVAAPVAASDQDLDAIDPVIKTAVAQLNAGEPAALDAVYEIVVDPVTLPKCRQYADASLTALLLTVVAQEYPDSASLRLLFEYTIEAAMVFRNDCLLAI
jgi:hypothetical protein